MATNKQRREATRHRIVSAARAAFTQHGYEQTHTEAILTAAGVSRGAMYHHFQNKQALFEAVYTAVAEEALSEVASLKAANEGPVEALTNACLAWLALVREADVATILLDQGPRVLGWQRARDIEARSSMALMRRSLERAVNAGAIHVASVEFTAVLLNAMLAEAALAAQPQRHESARQIPIESQEAVVRQFIEGLRINHS